MKNCSTREFLETIVSQDAWLKWRDHYFFVNGCCHEKSADNSTIVRLEMYEMDSSYQVWLRDVCTISNSTIEEVIVDFTHTPIFEGKNFWELENELEWL